jgi:hypothetical protein
MVYADEKNRASLTWYQIIGLKWPILRPRCIVDPQGLKPNYEYTYKSEKGGA